MGRGAVTQRGQAAVEAVAATLALAFLTLVGWQAVVAAHAWQSAESAARTAARAGSVGAPVKRAALAVLPRRLATRATVSVSPDPSGRLRVRVRVPIPRVLPGGESVGAVTGESRLDP